MRSPPIRLVFAAAAALSLGACGASGAAARPCASPSTCASGQACIAGLCRPAGAKPASPEAARIVLEATDIAVASSSGPSGGGDALPETFAFGRAADGTVVLLLRFEAPWRDEATIESAFLVLDAAPGAPPAREATGVDVARVLDAWSPDGISWGRTPRLGLPSPAAILRARPSRSARIDVTRFVRAWAKRSSADHGLAVMASGGDAFGHAFTTGLTHGAPPRLEVYLR